MQQEFLISDTNLRINVTGRQNMSIIFRNRGGQDEVVMLRGNQYTVLNKEKMDQMQGAMSQISERMKGLSPEQLAALQKVMKGGMTKAGKAGAGPKVVYTLAGSDTVNGIPCTRFTGKQGAEVRTTGCAAGPGQSGLTRAHQAVFERMRTFFEGFRNSMANSPIGAASMTDLTDPGIKGFPVQVTSFRGGKESSVFEVKSRDTVANPDFTTGNATESEMMMGPGSRR